MNIGVRQNDRRSRNVPPRTRPRAHHLARRAGFTLTELLIALGLLIFVSFVGVRVFATAVQVGRATAGAQDEIATTAAVLDALRRDAWGAREMQVDAKVARLVATDGREVAWKWAEDGALVRREGDVEQRWTPPVREGAFASEGAVLVIRGAGTDVNPIEVRLVSQVMIGGKR